MSDFGSSSGQKRWKPHKKAVVDEPPAKSQPVAFYGGKRWTPPAQDDADKPTPTSTITADDGDDGPDDPNGEYYTVEELRTMSVPGLDYKNREKYLRGKDYKALFGVSKEEFLAWPKWKQTKAKRTAKLF